MTWSSPTPRNEFGLTGILVSVALLLLPCVVLAALATRVELVQVTLFAGAGVQFLFALTLFRSHPVWKPPGSATLIIVYLIALVWLWLPTRGSTDWAIHLGQAILLLFSVGIAALHDLARTGAEALRRTNKLCRRISRRNEWPMLLAECRVLPEVAALREAAQDELRPVLALLSDPRPEVQCAVLGALEYRSHWKPGEAELVQRVAGESTEPAVRAAAAYALASVDSAELIAKLAAMLRDPEPEVRAAAAEALLSNAESRWPYARDGVREALADRRFAEDGALFAAGRLPAAALADLATWSEEHPPLSSRAIYTLVEQYNRDLTSGDSPELGNQLAAMTLDATLQPPLRVELAALLRDHDMLSIDLLDRLTNMDQPGLIRLFAAELMLRANPDDPDGIDVLRGLARQQNREMAVAIASILQNVLGYDLGLPEGESPEAKTKVAAEVTRRILRWANGATLESLRPTPGPMPGLKPPSRTMPALGKHASPPPKPSPLPENPHQSEDTLGGF